MIESGLSPTSPQATPPLGVIGKSQHRRGFGFETDRAANIAEKHVVKHRRGFGFDPQTTIFKSTVEQQEKAEQPKSLTPNQVTVTPKAVTPTAQKAADTGNKVLTAAPKAPKHIPDNQLPAYLTVLVENQFKLERQIKAEPTNQKLQANLRTVKDEIAKCMRQHREQEVKPVVEGGHRPIEDKEIKAKAETTIKTPVPTDAELEKLKIDVQQKKEKIDKILKFQEKLEKMQQLSKAKKLNSPEIAKLEEELKKINETAPKSAPPKEKISPSIRQQIKKENDELNKYIKGAQKGEKELNEVINNPSLSDSQKSMAIRDFMENIEKCRLKLQLLKQQGVFIVTMDKYKNEDLNEARSRLPSEKEIHDTVKEELSPLVQNLQKKILEHYKRNQKSEIDSAAKNYVLKGQDKSKLNEQFTLLKGDIARALSVFGKVLNDNGELLLDKEAANSYSVLSSNLKSHIEAAYFDPFKEKAQESLKSGQVNSELFKEYENNTKAALKRSFEICGPQNNIPEKTMIKDVMNHQLMRLDILLSKSIPQPPENLSDTGLKNEEFNKLLEAHKTNLRNFITNKGKLLGKNEKEIETEVQRAIETAETQILSNLQNNLAFAITEALNDPKKIEELRKGNNEKLKHLSVKLDEYFPPFLKTSDYYNLTNYNSNDQDFLKDRKELFNSRFSKVLADLILKNSSPEEIEKAKNETETRINQDIAKLWKDDLKQAIQFKGDFFAHIEKNQERLKDLLEHIKFDRLGKAGKALKEELQKLGDHEIDKFYKNLMDPSKKTTKL